MEKSRKLRSLATETSHSEFKGSRMTCDQVSWGRAWLGLPQFEEIPKLRSISFSLRRAGKFNQERQRTGFCTSQALQSLLKGGFRQISLADPVGHSFLWENRWNRSLRPENGSNCQIQVFLSENPPLKVTKVEPTKLQNLNFRSL